PPLVIEGREHRRDVRDVELGPARQSRQRRRGGLRTAARPPAEEPVDGRPEGLTGSASFAFDQRGDVVVERDCGAHDALILASSASTMNTRHRAPAAYAWA